MTHALWTDGVALPEFHTLRGNKKTDVLIIGGGMCGLLCAYFLRQAGVDVLLVEGNRIASGITKNTTAKITALHGLIYAKLLRTEGKEKAQMYLTANQRALHAYEQLCTELDCDFEKKPAYTYSLTHRARLEDEVRAVNGLGFPAVFTETPELPFQTQGAVCFPDQAQFHPLKFLAALTKGLPIYENTFIRDITPTTAIADCGTVTARHIIVATHFPFLNKHGSYFLKLYQHRSYVSAWEGAGSLKGMYVDEDKKGMSFRSYGDFLLLGGGGHRTGKHGGGWEELNTFARRHYPEAKLQFQWAAQDCMSLDAIPYIGQYSKGTPNLYVASGFHKWGMSSSMAAALLLTDMVTGKKNDLAPVFSPQRSMLKPQLFLNGIEATINLLTPTTKRCPHLGCALKWNPAEHTWDCPCHGSRFEENGKLIDNPATGDANI
ncbi:MAG: FAD-dependent oxidoreductase [Clostridia bacterium]|nr:FAD-dependent oxidoreductase [Clostridia bacterium]